MERDRFTWTQNGFHVKREFVPYSPNEAADAAPVMEMPVSDLSLDKAQIIVKAAFEHARSSTKNALAVCVLDARGALKAFAAQDGTSLKRGEIARGKANGALCMGVGSRSLFKRAKDEPFFISAAESAIGGSLIPVPGGVLIRGADGEIIGAVGVSGASSNDDEAYALAGIAAAGFTGDPGQD